MGRDRNDAVLYFLFSKRRCSKHEARSLPSPPVSLASTSVLPLPASFGNVSLFFPFLQRTMKLLLSREPSGRGATDSTLVERLGECREVLKSRP